MEQTVKEKKKGKKAMSQNNYLPEGNLIGTPENREAVGSLAGLERAMASGKILEGAAVRCGRDMTLEVDLGVCRGIIPRQEIALTAPGEAVRDIAAITRVGKAVAFRVLSVTRDSRGNPTALLSRREAQRECREQFLSRLLPGDIIPGRVTHMEQFGAFVDIGCGIVSLMTIDCISVSRISHPRDRFQTGDFIRAAVKSIDPETGRIYVTHRELLGTWEENAGRFEVGQTVAGVVRSVEDYGIFVELAPNLAGLAEPKAGITPGQTASVYIKNIIPDRMKLKLVMIDAYSGETERKRWEYFVGEDVRHMDRWRYSPPAAGKVIETVF